jgi:predicted deacetylase
VIPRPAQYLLRFDDLCPTHSRERWERFLRLIREFEIKPILAIVPENRDPALAVSSPDPGFWAEMRALQADGATIGLHGFRHICAARGRSMVPLHRLTEFAGVPETTQRQWIREGLEILSGHRLNPSIWVAPRHGFDRATLRVLREQGIGALSDGFAHRPFRRAGVVWIPQQLWAPKPRPRGLWTICLHPNTTTNAEVENLRLFLHTHASQFTSVERVLDELDCAPLNIAERIAASSTMLRIRTRWAWKNRLRHA